MPTDHRIRAREVSVSRAGARPSPTGQCRRYDVRLRDPGAGSIRGPSTPGVRPRPTSEREDR